eukprot:scaffold5337_cov167-Amphora_coffeaeformis.AAC.13
MRKTKTLASNLNSEHSEGDDSPNGTGLTGIIGRIQEEGHSFLLETGDDALKSCPANKCKLKTPGDELLEHACINSPLRSLGLAGGAVCHVCC